MVCGSKRYVVEAEIDEKITTDSVTARTPVEARKKYRLKYGKHINIVAVRESH